MRKDEAFSSSNSNVQQAAPKLATADVPASGAGSSASGVGSATSAIGSGAGSEAQALDYYRQGCAAYESKNMDQAYDLFGKAIHRIPTTLIFTTICLRYVSTETNLATSKRLKACSAKQQSFSLAIATTGPTWPDRCTPKRDMTKRKALWPRLLGVIRLRSSLRRFKRFSVSYRTCRLAPDQFRCSAV